MPTATLTWSSLHGDSNLQSTFAATNQGAIQLLNQYFTALALFADFPWTVCSFEGTTAPWFLTLKRKTGAAGRIVFIAPSSSPGATYNSQLGTFNWNNSNVRIAFFPLASSDTPANILSLSGDVFTNPGGGSGLGPSFAMTTGANLVCAFMCEDGLFMRYGTSTTATNTVIVGDLLEDDVGNQAPISMVITGGSLDGVVPVLSPTVGSAGGLSLFSGSFAHFGSGWAAPTGIAGYLRDLGLKESWFLPRSLCSYNLPLGQTMKYKLRQIAYGPTPLAAYEPLTDTGAVLKATSTFPAATTGYPWLTNFKV
jgi:hypothetical protein